MAVLLGTQYIRFTKDGTPQTFYLRVPLQHREAQIRQKRYVRESLDFSVRAVTTVGDGVSEVSGMLRWVDQPTVLMDMLKVGANGGLLIWYNGSIEVTAILVEPSGDVIKLNYADDAKPDFEVEVPIVLRITDGTDATTLIQG